MKTMMTAMEKADYKLPMQYKYTWNTLQNFGQFRDKRIWKNFTYFIDWMERNYNKKKFFEIMGKSYDLEDSILYRIMGTQVEKAEKDKKTQDTKTVETWLIGNIFRHVENPNKEENPTEKFVGKVKFEKVRETKYQNEYEVWTPSQNTPGDQNDMPSDFSKIDEKEIDIRITVYEDNEMKKERLYEKEHGWKEEWNDRSLLEPTQKKEFEKKWADLKQKNKVPGWYHFDPKNPGQRPEGHNMMKNWDPTMFKFLKEKKWNERLSETDQQERNQYKEKSEFVVDCTQLLGIGGEAVVIRKSVKEKVGEKPEGLEYEALKIIPLMKHNFEDEKLRELESRVKARHDNVNPEDFWPEKNRPRTLNKDLQQGYFFAGYAFNVFSII